MFSCQVAYKIFFSGTVGASEWKDVQLLSPWFILITITPSLRYKEHQQDLFCTTNVSETVSPQLTTYFKATKSQWKICAVFYTDWSASSPHPHSTSPQDLDCLEYLALHTLPIWPAKREPLSKHQQCCVTTCSHLSRSCWPGCTQPCTGQLSNSKHPTHIPARTENHTS